MEDENQDNQVIHSAKTHPIDHRQVLSAKGDAVELLQDQVKLQDTKPDRRKAPQQVVAPRNPGQISWGTKEASAGTAKAKGKWPGGMKGEPPKVNEVNVGTYNPSSDPKPCTIYIIYIIIYIYIYI